MVRHHGQTPPAASNFRFVVGGDDNPLGRYYCRSFLTHLLVSAVVPPPALGRFLLRVFLVFSPGFSPVFSTVWPQTVDSSAQWVKSVLINQPIE